MKFCYTVLAALVLAVAGASSAATPDQVGIWNGSLKTKVRTTTSTRSVKSAMTLEIAANDATTVTIDGVLPFNSTGTFNLGEGFIVYVDVSPTTVKQTFAVAHFKGTKVAGATSGATSGLMLGTELIDAYSGKFSLKKQP